MALPNRAEQKYSIETIQWPEYIKYNGHYQIEPSNSIKINEDEVKSWDTPTAESHPVKDYMLSKQAIKYSAETSLHGVKYITEEGRHCGER